MEKITTQPIGNLVIIKLKEVATKTQSGLYIPQEAIEKPSEGTVMAVGIGLYATATGELIPMQTKAGDIVAFPNGAGSPITIDGVEYKILRENDLFAKL